MAKQIICDKCEKKLVFVKNKSTSSVIREDFADMNDLFGNLNEVFGGMGFDGKKDEELEGSIIKVNLPKYNIIGKIYDLCEDCTKIFLENNIQKWLKEKKK